MDNGTLNRTFTYERQEDYCINHESWGTPIVFVESFSIIIGNIFVLVVLTKYSRKRFHPLNYFIVQLALADLFVGGIIFWIGFLSSKVFQYVTLIHGIFNYGILATASSVSTLTVLFIAIDRYIYVLKHHQYKLMITKRRTCCVISASWLVPTFVFIAAPAIGWSCVSVCNCSIYNMDDNLEYCIGEHCSQMMTPFRKETLIIGGICLLLSLILSALVYVLIIVQVKQKTKKFIRNKRRKKTEMRIIKTMIIVLGGFLLTTGPLAVLCVLSYFYNVRKLHLVMRIMVVISNLNSILNPFFYFLRIPYMSKNSRRLWESITVRFKSKNLLEKEFQSKSRRSLAVHEDNGFPMIPKKMPSSLNHSIERNVIRSSNQERETPGSDKVSLSSIPWSSHDML